MTTRRKDFLAYEGPSQIDGTPIVAVVTGVTRPSANVKTGPMLQMWILQQDIAPVEAVKTGQDVGICGHCPLKGTLGKQRTCYVTVARSPQAVWHKYRRGGYVPGTDSVVKAATLNAEIRLGAYGEPTAIPLSEVERVIEHARLWTGYTHRWPEIEPAWSSLLMASTETPEGSAAAKASGWRPFEVSPAGGGQPEGTFLCPAVREDNPLTCQRCGACAGTKYGSVNVGAPHPYVPAHGTGRNHLPVLQLSEF